VNPAGNERRRGPRMIDVARLAGVSQQTVSRVVNNSDNVAPELQERVERAIAHLRYRRNPAARALATSRSMSIGIVSFGLAQYGPSVALTGIADEARRAGYATSLVSLADVDRATMREALDHLEADSVDGIVVLAPIDAAMSAMESLESGSPLVAFHPGREEAHDRIVTDEAGGARAATEHLISLGHATVHHVSGPPGWLGTTARVRGWSEVLAERGLVARPPVAGDWTTPSGYAAGCALAGDDRVTAVFVANDQMALGVIKGLVDSGRRVPDDVSVVGFDDIPESGYFRPGLSTVRFDFAEVGRLAAARIFQLIEGDAPQPIPRIGFELVHRESARAPRRLRSNPVPNATESR
jgi:DNA-binding LacI/PurR family transcriptional regulator